MSEIVVVDLADGDGVGDADEIGDPSAPTDTDEDGVIDALDPDDDGDGIATADEGTFDVDADGVSNRLDDDSDGDGKKDAVEGTGDVDCDGVPDFLDGDDGLDCEGPPADTADTGAPVVPDPACGCASTRGAGAAGALAALALVVRRRRS